MTGRPSSYTPAVGDEICELTAERICEREEMPARQTVMRWVESNPEFRDQFLLARVHMFDWIADEIIRIADDSTGDVFFDNDTGRAVADHARIQRDRLRVDSRKWLLSKQDAKRYGDKLAVEADTAKEPIVIRWANSDPTPPPAPEPPRQITYSPPKLPGDLSERDWGLLLAVLERIKARTPADRPPGEVLEAIGKAIGALFQDPAPAKQVLPRRVATSPKY
jgi:hypothetical protein